MDINMNILFASSLCSTDKYNEIFRLRNKPIITPSQKFFDLLIRGMTDEACDVKITCMSALPVSASSCNKLFWNKEVESVNDNLSYLYLPFINGKLLRYVTLYFSSFFYSVKWFLRNRKQGECCFISDPLVYTITNPTFLAAKLCNISKIMILTDLPSYAEEKIESRGILPYIKKIINRRIEKQIECYDGYVVLTDEMNNVVNPYDRPSLTVECSVEAASTLTNVDKQNSCMRTIVYAGGVYKKYGVEKLVRAFAKGEFENTELVIYGNGDYTEELVQFCNENPCVRYGGCVSLSEIVEIEKKATLLVNPRPTADDYTRYSFPSKTAEYLVSGTPVLSTKLVGIPSDYEGYIFWFNEESEEGIIEALRVVLMHSDEELQAFGEKARKFMLSNKENHIQGKRITDFVQSVLNAVRKESYVKE